MFSKRSPQQGRPPDLTLLPPVNLRGNNMLRAVFVAKLWQSMPTSWIEAPEITNFRWDIEGKSIWVGEVFPEDVERRIQK